MPIYAGMNGAVHKLTSLYEGKAGAVAPLKEMWVGQSGAKVKIFSSGPNINVSTTPLTGVSYTNGLNGLTTDIINEISKAISNNSQIDSSTITVYVDFGSEHRKLSCAYNGFSQVPIKLLGTEKWFFIIGFNHDDLSDPLAYGEATATGKAGITLQISECYIIAAMGYSNSNGNRWENCLARLNTIPSIYSRIDSNWKSIIKPVNKKTGPSTDRPSDPIQITQDNLFLLSEVEVFNTTKHSFAGEGSQYAYYKAGNSAYFYYNDGYSDQVDTWWGRSPDPNSRYDYFSVYYGNSSSDGAMDENGIVFAMCV